MSPVLLKDIRFTSPFIITWCVPAVGNVTVGFVPVKLIAESPSDVVIV